MESIITKGQQKSIDIRNINKNALNTYHAEDLDDLRNSIITNGLITPVSVIGPFEDDTYLLIAGERRLNIFKELYESGKEEYRELPAYIVGGPDMGETEQQLLIEASNLDTRDGYDKQTHYLRVVKLLKQYGTEQGLSNREYLDLRKRYMKCSPRYARFFEQIFEDGNEKLQEMVEKGEVSVSRAGRIANMPDYMQESAINDLKSGMNQDAVIKKYSQMQREIKHQEKEGENIKSEEIESEDMKPDEWEQEQSKAPAVPIPQYSEETETENSFESEFPDDPFDFDFNSMDTSFLNNTSLDSAEKDSVENEIQTVIHWCNGIISKKNPTEEEWDAIEACKRVSKIF